MGNYRRKDPKHTKLRNITCSVDVDIIKTIDTMVKNGWLPSRSEYMRYLIFQDIQNRYLETTQCIDLNPALDKHHAIMKQKRELVERLYAEKKSIDEIIQTVRMKGKDVRAILFDKLTKQEEDANGTETTN